MPIPKAITAHGWLLFDNAKMSKSKGNIVRTETILEAFGEHVYAKQFPESTKRERDLFATDVLRYFLLREIPFGQDGSFSFDALVTRYNADLANGYGNLVSRTLKLIEQNFEGTLPLTGMPLLFPDRWNIPEYESGSFERSASPDIGTDLLIRNIGKRLPYTVNKLFETPGVSLQAIAPQIMNQIALTDGYISFRQPWEVAKESSDLGRQTTG